MARVIIEFKPGEYIRIARWANAERRTVADQIAYVVMRTLRRASLDTDDSQDAESATAEDDAT